MQRADTYLGKLIPGAPTIATEKNLATENRHLRPGNALLGSYGADEEREGSETTVVTMKSLFM
ncbi:unnamed protein product, partial [marine sediment metagenome]